MRKEENASTGTKTENTNTGSQNTGSQNTGSAENTNTGSQNTSSENMGGFSQLGTLLNAVDNVSRIAFTRNDTASGVEQVTDKEGNEVGLMKEYKFLTKHGKRETFKTFDVDIITATEKIGAAIRGKRTLTFVIAKELSRLNNPETLKKMGFDTIADYAYCLFDLQKSTANQYARIGKLFINDDYRPVSHILPSSLSVSHYLELLKYVKDESAAEDIEKIEKAYVNGTIADGISTMRLRKALKEEFENVVASDSEDNTKSGSEDNTKSGSEDNTKSGFEDNTKSGFEDNTNEGNINPLQKDVAKVFAATIFLRDFVKEHFSDDVEFAEGVAKILSLLDESSKALLTAKTE